MENNDIMNNETNETVNTTVEQIAESSKNGTLTTLASCAITALIVVGAKHAVVWAYNKFKNRKDKKKTTDDKTDPDQDNGDNSDK